MSSLSYQPPGPGWYPDPADDSRQRWWSGEVWTDHAQEHPDASTVHLTGRSEEATMRLASTARSGELPLRRSANAFVIHFSDSRLVRALVSNYARAHGGAWVGGNATITFATLEFRTNAANRLLHGRRGDLTIDLRLIQDIVVERALVSDIIAVRSPEAIAQLRCLRAEDFADVLWEAAARARLAVGNRTPLPPVRRLSEGRLASELAETLRSLLF